MDEPVFYVLKGCVPVPVDTIEEWTKGGHKQIALDRVRSATVSTIFIGLPTCGDYKRYFFETMVLGGPLDGARIQSKTYNDATKTHKEMVAELKRRWWRLWLKRLWRDAQIYCNPRKHAI